MTKCDNRRLKPNANARTPPPHYPVIMAEEAAELNAEIRQFYTAVGVAQ